MPPYRKKVEVEKHPGHNHPINDECGPHCPRNEKYKGPVKKPAIFQRK